MSEDGGIIVPYRVDLALRSLRGCATTAIRMLISGWSLMLEVAELGGSVF